MYWDWGHYNKDKHLNQDKQGVAVTHMLFFYSCCKKVFVFSKVFVFLVIRVNHEY